MKKNQVSISLVSIAKIFNKKSSVFPNSDHDFLTSNLFLVSLTMLRTLILASFLTLLTFFTGGNHLSAQCADSNLVQNGAYCDPQWIPVCACDGKTYRNDCFARNKGMLQWSYGICDAVDFDFNPDPPTDYIDVDAILKNPGFMNVQLMDRFGRVFYSTAFDGVSELRFQIDIRGFPTGLYFINIWCNDGFKVRKVIIPDVY